MENYLVVERLYDDDDNVTETEPKLRIKGATGVVRAKELKDVLDRLGYSFQWGLHTVVAEDAWPAGDDILTTFDDEVRQALLTSADEVHYDDLLDQLNDEKRVTLRLPKGLHTLTAKEAAKKGVSVNQFCIGILSEAVNYAEFVVTPGTNKEQ